MALDGPYTLADLLAMTGHKPRRKIGLLKTHPLRQDPAAHPVRLLGIDPGTRLVGWGAVERAANGGLRLMDCGCIAPGRTLDLKERLACIFSHLEEVVRHIRPHAAALEETFAGVNMKSAIAMGEGRGVALLVLGRAHLPVLELSPRTIKQALTGSGASGKARVAAMVAAQLGLKTTPRPADVTDALAVAIALARRGL